MKFSSQLYNLILSIISQSKLQEFQLVKNVKPSFEFVLIYLFGQYSNYLSRWYQAFYRTRVLICFSLFQLIYPVFNVLSFNDHGNTLRLTLLAIFSFIFLSLFLCFQRFEKFFTIGLFISFLSIFFNNFLVTGEIDLLLPILQ